MPVKDQSNLNVYNSNIRLSYPSKQGAMEITDQDRALYLSFECARDRYGLDRNQAECAFS